MRTWMGAWLSRLIAGLALSIVAGVTGVVSYTHIFALTVALHGSPLVATLMPFGVDGLIVVGSVVLLQAIPGQAWLGWLGVVPGVATSLFANIESGLRYGPLAAGWAGVPAGSFALATFLLERWLKAQAGRGGSGGLPVPCGLRHVADDYDFDNSATASQCPHGVANTAEEAVVTAFLHWRDCLDETPSQRQLSASFGVSRPKVAELVGNLNGSGPVPAGNGAHGAQP